MAFYTSSINDANEFAVQYSRAVKATVLVYQTGAHRFAAALCTDVIDGLTTGMFRNGASVECPGMIEAY
jgi:hypothetical protein